MNKTSQNAPNYILVHILHLLIKNLTLISLDLLSLNSSFKMPDETIMIEQQNFIKNMCQICVTFNCFKIIVTPEKQVCLLNRLYLTQRSVKFF